jgi:hypothetical protein
MALVVPNEGKKRLLEILVNKESASNVVLKLFKNDYTPVDGSQIGDFTESTTTGYVKKTLTGGSWSVVDGLASYAQQTFTYTAGGTHYGYYITNATEDTVLWAERFTDAPHTIPSGGGTEKITVKLALSYA